MAPCQEDWLEIVISDVEVSADDGAGVCRIVSCNVSNDDVFQLAKELRGKLVK
jgi:hypothetical protein